MRLLRIAILCYNKKEAELFGDDTSKDIEEPCYIDLDKVASAHDSPEGGIVICLDNPKHSFLTRSFTLDEFVELWRIG